ncbi:hypothetical protein BH24BAC1_BH24BAC1_37660 [soil metagenome]
MRRDQQDNENNRRGQERGGDNRRDRGRQEDFRGEDRQRDRNEGQYENPYRLHEQDHGNNSRQGNYRTDSHFNTSYGRRGDVDYDHQNDFNQNPGRAEYRTPGENRPGGARYDGDDWYGTFNRSDNPYGRVRQPEGRSPYEEYGLRDYQQDQENSRRREENREDGQLRKWARDRNGDTGEYGYRESRSQQDFGRPGDPVGQRLHRPDFQDRREDRYEQQRETRRNDTGSNLRNDRQNDY